MDDDSTTDRRIRLRDDDQEELLDVSIRSPEEEEDVVLVQLQSEVRRHLSSRRKRNVRGRRSAVDLHEAAAEDDLEERKRVRVRGVLLSDGDR